MAFKRCRAVISEVVEREVILIVDENDHLVHIEEEIDELGRSELMVEQILEEYPQEKELPEHREIN